MTMTGRLEVNYLWLPTWLGINSTVLRKLEELLSSQIVGMQATEENLDQINDLVLDTLVEEHKEVIGLRDYLDGLKFVQTGV